MKPTATKPVRVRGIRTPYSFGLNYDDPRVRHNEDVQFVVWNCHSEAQARQRLREFLADLQACELTLPK